MQTIYLDANNLAFWKSQAKPNVMALGFFDGVHNGHKKVIQTAANIAKEKNVSLAVMSFFPHPKTVIGNQNTTFDYLMPLSKKASIMESLGVDVFYIVTFNKAFLSLSPEQFIAKYLLEMNVRHAVAGFDFSYGHKGAGTIDRMKKDSFDQIDVTKVDQVDFQGKKISSTWIRELVSLGALEMLTHILGRYYETEAYWNGNCLIRSPYFTFPAKGVYEVAIKVKRNIQNATVMVSDEQNKLYLLDRTGERLLLNEKIEIIWLSNIQTEQSLHTEKAFIV